MKVESERTESRANEPAASSVSSPSRFSTLVAFAPPLTPGGVGGFSQTTFGRLFIVQSMVAVLTTSVVIWFLVTAWIPVALLAIRQLPETGEIVDQPRDPGREPASPLSENRFIAFYAEANPPETGVASRLFGSLALPSAGPHADLRIGLSRDRFAICSWFGCFSRKFPAGALFPLNRAELEAWWGAWELTFFGMASLGVLLLLFLSWIGLATFCGPLVWMLAYFKDRQLTMLGSWKLVSAALLPGSLLVTSGLVLYGLGVIGLLELFIVWILHLWVGPVYLFTALFGLPRVPSAVRRGWNPFGQSRKSARSRNPFDRAKKASR
jgi:hypothetical protein